MFRGKETSKTKATTSRKLLQGPSTSESRTPDGEDNLYSHEQIVSIAKKNQRAQQQKRRTNQKREVNVKKQPGQPQARKQVSTRRRSKHIMPPKNTQQKNTVKRKLK